MKEKQQTKPKAAPKGAGRSPTAPKKTKPVADAAAPATRPGLVRVGKKGWMAAPTADGESE